jgi:metal-responsive CopG/Arc/MetJ family transcriptional regulator
VGREYRSLVTVSLPVRLVERMEPYTDRRERSLFVEQAIEHELDRREQAERNDDRAAAAV